MQIIAVFRSLLAPGLPWEIGKSAHWHLQPPPTPPALTQPLKKKKRKEDTIYSTKITRGQRLKLLLPLLDTFFGACHTSTLPLSSGGATE